MTYTATQQLQAANIPAAVYNAFLQEGSSYNSLTFTQQMTVEDRVFDIVKTGCPNLMAAARAVVALYLFEEDPDGM